MQIERSRVAKLLQLPEFKDRRVEVNLLGGLASFKIDHNDPARRAIEGEITAPARQLEDPDLMRVRELSELSRLLENNLITLEEYDRVKNILFSKPPPA